MSKNMSGEKFLEVVASTMEKQLKEWDENYEVMVMKLINYEVVIKNQETYYHIELTEDELKSLQDRGAFSVDRTLWAEFEKQGLQLIRGYGNYLDYVFLG